MGVWEGLLGGFVQRKGEVEQENIRQQDLANQRENAIYAHLLTSDDPEVASLALSGLLEGAQPKKKKSGLSGWVGEMQQSPTFAKMQALINTPTPVTAQKETLPTISRTGGVPAMPAIQPQVLNTPEGAPAAQPAENRVTPTATPPPMPTTYQQTGGTPFGPPQPTGQVQPRHIFLGAMEKYKQEAIAKAGADIEGDIQAWTPYLGRQGAIERTMRERSQKGAGGAGTVQALQGTLPDGSLAYGILDKRPGSPTFSHFIHPDTGELLPGFQPRATTASASTTSELLSKALFGKSAVSLSQPEAATLLEAQQLQKSVLTTQQAIAAAQRFLPNATVDAQLQLADALKSGTAAPVTPGGPPAPAAAAAGAQAPSTPSAAPTTPPTPKTLSGAVSPALGAQTKETGKPIPVQVQQAIARTQSMNDNIDKALAALEPYKADSSLEGTMKLVEKYRAGTESDPFALAAAQLPDLAGLQQSASATLGGTSRSQRIYADKRQHTPRLPSGRQIMFAHMGLGADTVSKLSQMKEGDAGGFDSPAQMYQKLKGLKDANTAFLKDMQDATSRTPGAPTGPPAPSTTPAPQAYQDAQGNWHIKQ